MARGVKKLKVTSDGWEVIGKELLDGFQLIIEEKGIELDEIYAIFQEALTRGLLKELDGGNDAVVSVEVNQEKNSVRLAQLKEVVEEVEDDYLEVEYDEIKDEHPELKVGDQLRIPFLLSAFGRPAVQVLMNNFNQKIIEAEKRILFEVYKDKVDQIITGVVEKVEGNAIYVDIGKTTVRLSRRDLIGNEQFEAREQIKLYVDKVDSTTKGARINVSRSHPGFLRKLFEEEIPEVYERIVLIKNDEPLNNIFGVVREAGTRAKVAVYTNNPSIDPVASCIGPNGSRIQKIVSQLGSGRNRENVDVVLYSNNQTLFIADALKPAQVSGVILNEIHKSATVIVPDNQVSVSIGLRGSNIRLAQQMTGYTINILTESDAAKDNIEFDAIGDVMISNRRQEELAKQSEIQQKRKAFEESLVNLDDISSTYDMDSDDEHQEETPVGKVEEKVADTAIETPLSEQVIEEETSEEATVEKEEKETVVITTTTTLEDLEKQLEAENKDVKQDPKFKKPRKKPTKKDKPAETPKQETKSYERLDIYSQEELEQLENEIEDEDGDEFDIDYEDFEDYYDED